MRIIALRGEDIVKKQEARLSMCYFAPTGICCLCEDRKILYVITSVSPRFVIHTLLR